MNTLSDGTTTITPLLVLGYEAERTSRNVGHELVGGGYGVSLAIAGARVGTLRLLFATEQAATDCVNMHSTPARFTLASDELTTINMQYVVAPAGRINRQLEPTTRVLWLVEIDFREVT